MSCLASIVLIGTYWVNPCHVTYLVQFQTTCSIHLIDEKSAIDVSLPCLSVARQLNRALAEARSWEVE